MFLTHSNSTTGRRSFSLANKFLISILLLLPLFVSCAENTDYKNFHQAAFVADLHDDTPISILHGFDIGVRNSDGQIDMPRMRDGGMDLIFFSVWLFPSDYLEKDLAFQKANEIIDAVEAVEQKYPSQLRLIRTADEAISTVEEGMLAGTFGMEGGYPIEEDLSKLEHFFDRGVRYFAPTWNNNTSWATSAEFETTDTTNSVFGLTKFGQDVIRKCNELGILIDVSHSGEQTVKDILEISEDPIIASHSSVWNLTPHFRNLKDYQLRAIAAGGGVVFINFYSGYLDSTYQSKFDALLETRKSELDSIKEELEFLGKGDEYWEARNKFLRDDIERIKPPFEVLIDHIDYVAKLVGVEHVGLGSDFDGVSSMPKGMNDVRDLPKITQALFSRGYSKGDVKKILGENLLRVFRKVTG